MKNKDFLDDYVKELLNNSRAEEPVLSLDEVSKTLDIMVPKKAAKGWGFYLAGLTGMLVLFSLIFWFLLPQNNLENTTPSKSQLPKIGFKESQNSKPALVQNSSPKSLFVPTQILHEDSATAEENRVPRFEDVPFLVNNFDFEENEKELVLSYEELAKLGIYTDGCVLKYTNLKDSMFLDKSYRRNRDIIPYFLMDIHSSGGGITLNNTSLGDSLRSLYVDSLLDVYPMMIEKIVTNFKSKYYNLNIGDKKTDFLEQNVSTLFAESYKEYVKSTLVPVKISLVAVEDKYGKTDNDVIFWFKPNEAFLKLLPLNLAIKVKSQYSNFLEADYQSKLIQLRKQRETEQNEIEIKKQILDSVLLNALVLNQNQLRKLGFRKNKLFYAVNGNWRIRILHNQDFNIPQFNFISRRKEFSPRNIHHVNPIPLFTYNGVGSINVIDKNKFLDESKTYSDFQFEMLKYFALNWPNLIPVKIQIKDTNGKYYTEYFWYVNSEKFKAIIN
jgi:hypothetical protein